MSTLHVRKAKGAVRDATRILGYEPSIGDTISKLIPTVVYGDDGEKTKDLSIQQTLEVVPEFKTIYEQYKDIIDLASRLEGLPSSAGLHAAGILISPIDFTKKLPLIKSNTDGVLATSLDLESAEHQFVKMDYLAIATMNVILKTEQDSGYYFDYANDDYDDDKVWNVIGSKNTTGLFQIASKTYKDRMPRLKPRSMKELAACIALVRGPAISAKTDELYMQIIEGTQEIKKIHPLYDEITKDTNGVLIFQEQIMKLAVNFGMDLSTGYKIVKLGAKKKMNDLEEYRNKFIELSKDKDCDIDTVNELFDIIVRSSEYLFNQSHAISYAMITYASAYMKVHYPLQYMKNLLSNAYERGEKETYSSILADCRRLGIQFLPPDINKSSFEFTIEDGKIRIGLCAVKNLGEKAITEIVNNRPFTSLNDMLSKVAKRAVNRKIINVSIFSGLFNSFKENEGLTKYKIFENYIHDILNEEIIPEEISLVGKSKFKTTANDIELEEVLLGANFIFDPANNLNKFGWYKLKAKTNFNTDCYLKDVKTIKTKTGDTMAFVSLSTGDGIIDGTIFPKNYKKIPKRILKKNTYCIIKAKKEDDEKCIVNSIIAL